MSLLLSIPSVNREKQGTLRTNKNEKYLRLQVVVETEAQCRESLLA